MDKVKPYDDWRPRMGKITIAFGEPFDPRPLIADVCRHREHTDQERRRLITKAIQDKVDLLRLKVESIHNTR
jgi:hypothetical protein